MIENKIKSSHLGNTHKNMYKRIRICKSVSKSNKSTKRPYQIKVHNNICKSVSRSSKSTKCPNYVHIYFVHISQYHKTYQRRNNYKKILSNKIIHIKMEISNL